jgi:copper oxidase (laccase) domain-containing protein
MAREPQDAEAAIQGDAPMPSPGAQSSVLSRCPVETFPALSRLPVIHGFTRRVPGLDVKADRDTALRRLDAYHDEARTAMGLESRHFRTARQVHGAGVAIVDANSPECTPGVDALVTASRDVCLGIYVADCGPVFFVDPARQVIAAAHSGRKGTALGAVSATISAMREGFGCDPADIVVQLGPCIRPPHYEIDFAAEILRQTRDAGAREVYDCTICTAANLDRYYSYRLEKGQTCRMLAILALA